MILYLVGTGYTRNYAIQHLAGRIPNMDGFKYTHQHYWWLNQHGHQIAQLVLEAMKQSNEELAA